MERKLQKAILDSPGNSIVTDIQVGWSLVVGCVRGREGEWVRAWVRREEGWVVGEESGREGGRGIGREGGRGIGREGGRGREGEREVHGALRLTVVSRALKELLVPLCGPT